MIKALGKSSEINLCRVCDSLYSLVSRQKDRPSVCMSVCAYLNYFLIFKQIMSTKVTMDFFHKWGGFKTIYMRKGAIEKKLEKSSNLRNLSTSSVGKSFYKRY